MSSPNATFVQTPEPKRTVMACRICRSRKIKCYVENGETRCTNCIKANVEHCIFTPVNSERGNIITQSSQGPYTTQQFRVERPADYAHQLPNAQPTQSSVHSWSIYSGDAVPPPPQRAPPPQPAPTTQSSHPANGRAPNHQGTANICPQYGTYPPSNQYDPYSHYESQQQPVAEMYAFVGNVYPGSWVPGQPSNQGTAFPGQFNNPQQNMVAPASSSTHPPYGHADPNVSWSGNASANFYYPERNDDEQPPFDGQGSF